MTRRALTCRELTDALWRYLDGEMAPVDRAAFDEHLRECPSCGAYLESYLATVEIGRSAFAETDGWVPAEAPEEVVQGILAARRAGA